MVIGIGMEGSCSRRLFLTEHLGNKEHSLLAAFAQRLGLLDCFCFCFCSCSAFALLCLTLLLCWLGALLLDFSRAKSLHCLAGDGSAVDVAAVWAVFLFKNDDGLSRVLVLFAKRSQLDVSQKKKKKTSGVFRSPGQHISTVRTEQNCVFLTIFFSIELFVLCKWRFSSFVCRVALSSPLMLIELKRTRMLWLQIYERKKNIYIFIDIKTP